MDNITLKQEEAAQVEALYSEEQGIEVATQALFNASVQRSTELRGKWKKRWDELHVTYSLDHSTNYTLSNKSGTVTLVENPTGDDV